MNKKVLKLGKVLFAFLVEKKDDPISYKGLEGKRMTSYCRQVVYDGHPIIEYDSEDHNIRIYGSDSAIVRKIQNSFLFLFGYKVTKIRMKSETSIKNLNDNGNRFRNLTNDRYSNRLIPVYTYFFKNNSPLYSILDTNCRVNGCNVSRAFIDLNVPRRLSIAEMRSFDLTDDYEHVTFIPANKPNAEKFRTKMKLGKFVKKQFKDRFSDSQIESFVNYVKSKSPSSYKFRIVEGRDIKKFYDGSLYARGSATLEGSCMKAKECQSYFKIYTENSDVCKMLILVNKEDEILGRALLWNFINQYDKKKYSIMDRIYGTDSTVERFKNWAKENKYWTKDRQSYDYKHTWITPKDEFVDKHFKIKLNTEFRRYPYIDSFSFMSDGYISTDDTDYNKGVAHSTGGGLCEDDYHTCYHSENRYHVDDMQYCEDIDDYVHCDYAVYCDIRCEYVYQENTITLVDGEQVHEDCAVFCDYDQHFVREGDDMYCDYSNQSFDPDENHYEEIDGVGIVLDEFVKECYEEEGYVYNKETDEWEIED